MSRINEMVSVSTPRVKIPRTHWQGLRRIGRDCVCVDGPSAAALARILDAVATCNAAGALPGAAQPALEAQPTKESLPAAVRAMDIVPILFVNRSSRLSFQSTLHALSWARVRSAYAACGAEMA